MDYSIGTLAARAGYAVQTLRYFEQTGLMPQAPRTAGGQRRYGEKELRRLLFIRHARDLGFELDAVRSLLKLAGHPDAPCEAADAIAIIISRRSTTRSPGCRPCARNSPA